MISNWSSWFAQSAWTWEEARQEYYLHLYCIEQPDLNWNNEEVSDDLRSAADKGSLYSDLLKCRQAIYQSSMRFWLDKGVDGFRIDTVNHYSKPLDFPDAPISDPKSDIQRASKLFCNGPEMHKYVKEMGAILNEYGAMSVGELPDTPDAKMVFEYVSKQRKELSMVFPFDIVDLGRDQGPDLFDVRPYKLTQLKDLVKKWQVFVQESDAWSSVFLENHDQARCISRFANDSVEYRVQSGKMLAMMVLTQTGTPYIYMGQELGMTNIPLEWSEKEYLDVNTINYLAKARKEGTSEEYIKNKLMPLINSVARDNARTPVQWSDAENAGFSTAKPWMRVNDNYKEVNAEKQLNDPDSVYRFYRNVILLRKEHLDIFTYGDFDVYDADNEQVFSFIKTAKSGEKAFIALNFSTSEQPFNMPDNFDAKNIKKVLCTRSLQSNTEPLQAYEGRLFVL
jgi:oligo-1,6-glucosidase